MKLPGNPVAGRRLFSAALAMFLAAGALSLGATPARADKEKTYRYLTYGLGAATAYMGAKGKMLPAVVGAAGTYLVYKKWNDAKNDRHERWGYGGDRRGRDHRDHSRRDDRWDNNSRWDNGGYSSDRSGDRRNDRDDDHRSRRGRDYGYRR